MTASKPVEHVHYWRDAALEDLELLHAYYVNHRFAPHTHETFAIGVILEGAQAYTPPREGLDVMPAGSIAVINPGKLHAGHAADEYGYRYRMLYPHPRILQGIAEELSGRSCGVPYFPNPVIYDKALARRLALMHRTLEDTTTPLLTRQSVLVATLGQMIHRHAVAPPQAERVGHERYAIRQARAYLEAHFCEPVSLDTLAAVSGLSRFHLCRVFAKEVGMPPHQYLLQIRLRRAKALLRQGATIAAAAFETGFADQSHLTRWFQKIVGTTPGVYQRSVRS